MNVGVSFADAVLSPPVKVFSSPFEIYSEVRDPNVPLSSPELYASSAVAMFMEIITVITSSAIKAKKGFLVCLVEILI